MALTVNTNIASLTAQRNLTSSQNDLSTSLERLSSGLRINSARDDAAGLAITERFTAQIRGLNQGVRNANDGISLSQTAEGALSEVTNNLQRIRELAVQSSNASNTSADRTALQTEVSALLAEIQRVATKSNFNGNTLLDGTFSGAVFQVGADKGDTITFATISSMQTSALGTTTTNTDGGLTVAASAITGFATAISAGDLTINGTDIGALAGASSAAGRAGDLVGAINAISATTGVGASYNSATGNLTLNSDAAVVIAGAANDLTITGYANATISTLTTSTGIDTLTVANYAGAQTGIALIDSALSTVNTQRAALGASQSRFESVVANQQTAAENLSASRSRIQDADFAAETAQLTNRRSCSSQVLQCLRRQTLFLRTSWRYCSRVPLIGSKRTTGVSLGSAVAFSGE